MARRCVGAVRARCACPCVFRSIRRPRGRSGRTAEEQPDAGCGDAPRRPGSTRPVHVGPRSRCQRTRWCWRQGAAAAVASSGVRIGGPTSAPRVWLKSGRSPDRRRSRPPLMARQNAWPSPVFRRRQPARRLCSIWPCLTVSCCHFVATERSDDEWSRPLPMGSREIRAPSFADARKDYLELASTRRWQGTLVP